MINLLPNEYKSEIRAARTNVLIVRYIILLLAGVVLIAGLLAATYFSLTLAQDAAKERVAENEKREAEFADTKKEADQFRSDLAIAKAIIDNEVQYSSLIYKISAVLPKNVILDSLSVDSQTIGTQVTFSASAKSTNDALALKTAFENEKELFSNVYFESITYQEEASSYKYKTSLSVVINKEAL